MTSQRYGVGMPAWLDGATPLELAPGHPTAHAGFLLDVTSDAGVITSAEMTIGFMHRSAEKLFESRDYRQVMMLANRHDWLSALHSELLLGLALEEAMGITPPERATWTRMLLAEANRAAVALAFIAPLLENHACGLAWSLREQLVSLQETLTGSRMHPMFTRIGGVARGLDTSELQAAREAVAYVREGWAQVEAAVEDAGAATAGIAVLTADQAKAFGASGAPARASGLGLDLRRDTPYLAYDEVTQLLPTPSTPALGDAAARYRDLASQIHPSLAIADLAVDRLETMLTEPFDVSLPKTVRAPEGTTLASIEGPLGIMGCVLVSAGDRMPWRLRLRTASYGNAQAMQAALVGTYVDQLADSIMSFTLVVGDIDR